MDRKTVIATGATVLAAAAALLGGGSAASAAEPVSAAKAFTIEAVALPGVHTGIVTPDFKACCGVIGSCP